MVAEKRKLVPVEIEEACEATSRKIEGQLDETEQFIISKRLKALDDSVTSVQEAHKRIDSFASESLGKLGNAIAESAKSAEKIHKTFQSINKINMKWHNLEKEKNLNSFVKQCIADLKQEFPSLD